VSFETARPGRASDRRLPAPPQRAAFWRRLTPLALVALAPLLGAATPPLTVNLRADGADRELKTQKATVAEVLQEAGLSVDADDEVLPRPATLVTSGMRVEVVRVERKVLHNDTVLPYRTIVKKAWRQLAPGASTRVQGKHGRGRKVVEQVFRNGKLISERVLSRTVVAPPVDKIVFQPMRARQLASRGGFFLGPRTLGAPPATGSRTLTMSATAYHPMVCGTGRTATGMRARRGVVAVDPRVIRLGTRLYVEGYGPAIAADTGGAIKGRKIDLCMPSYGEIRRFGRRRVKVHILN
jgi:3D (Asp-Asp-Asp) domain-containing protein/sulfur carrier protein ThiS